MSKTLGDLIVERTIEGLVDPAKKLTTKRVLRRCLPSLRSIVDQVASPEATKMAFPASYGRLVIFATPETGMAVDMLEWSAPIESVPNEELGDRAVIWATLTGFINNRNMTAALTTLATRLGRAGMAQFDASFSQVDALCDTLDVGHGWQITGKASLVVLSGTESNRFSTGVVGSIPVPVLMRPGPVKEWHNDGWTADGNHRLLH